MQKGPRHPAGWRPHGDVPVQEASHNGSFASLLSITMIGRVDYPRYRGICGYCLAAVQQACDCPRRPAGCSHAPLPRHASWPTSARSFNDKVWAAHREMHPVSDRQLEQYLPGVGQPNHPRRPHEQIGADHILKGVDPAGD